MRWAIALAVTAGCWRGSDTTTTPPPSSDEPTSAEVEAARVKHPHGAQCTEVADHVRDIVNGGNNDGLKQRADQIRDAIARRCDADRWSQELRRCLAGAVNLDDTDGCEKLATKEQQDALEHEVELMDNAD